MSDKEFSDIDDLDDFLFRDSVNEALTSDLSQLFADDPLSQFHEVSDLARLNHRVTHISRNLSQVLSTAIQRRLDLDEQYSTWAELKQDLDNWEAVMTNLEGATSFLPKEQPIEYGTLAQETAADKVCENDFSDAAAYEHTWRDLTQLEELAADMLAEHSRVEAGKPLIGDNDTTLNRDHSELLQALAVQCDRIRALEAHLQAAAPAKHAEPVPADTCATDNAPCVNRLVIVVNGNDNLKFPLSSNIMTIGREPSNNIHIRSRYISRFHARIVNDQHGSVIEDLGSSNGISINSEKVRRAQLRSGDLIDLGRVQLKFIDLMEATADEGTA